MTQEEFLAIGDDEFALRFHMALVKGSRDLGSVRLCVTVSPTTLERLRRMGHANVLYLSGEPDSVTIYVQKDKVPDDTRFIAAFPIKTSPHLMDGNIEMEPIPA